MEVLLDGAATAAQLQANLQFIEAGALRLVGLSQCPVAGVAGQPAARSANRAVFVKMPGVGSRPKSLELEVLAGPADLGIVLQRRAAGGYGFVLCAEAFVDDRAAMVAAFRGS